MTSSVAFDIETTGYDPARQLFQYEPKFNADARLKDADKIAADISAKQDEWLSKAALDAGRAKVLVIGTLCDGVEEVMEGEEEAIIPWFWEVFSKSRCNWIGHNISGFDIPFLCRRSFILGIKIPPGVIEGRYLNRRFVDTMTTWSCGEYGNKISLDNLARALGVGKKSGSGKDFAELYKSDKPAAMKYLSNDLQLTHKCALKMGLL